MAEWHYSLNGEKHGPVSTDELKVLARSGKIARDDLVWRTGLKEWVKAKSIKDLFADASTAALPPNGRNTDEWYFSNAGSGHGPFSLIQIRQLFAIGKIKSDDRVWQCGETTSQTRKDLCVTTAPTFERPSPRALIYAAVILLLIVGSGGLLVSKWSLTDKVVGVAQSLIERFESSKSEPQIETKTESETK